MRLEAHSLPPPFLRVAALISVSPIQSAVALQLISPDELDSVGASLYGLRARVLLLLTHEHGAEFRYALRSNSGSAGR